MIVLKILGILLLIIFILLFCPIIFKINHQGENTDFTIKFLLFSFKNIGKGKKKKKTKTKKEKKKKIKKKKKKKVTEETKKKKEKIDVNKLLKLVLISINSGSKAFIKLVKGVKIYDVEVYFIVASYDAYETALKFAKIQGAFHTTLAILKNAFTIELDKVIIEPNFINENEQYDYKLKVKIKPITIIFCCIYFIFNFGFKFLKENKNTLQETQQEDKNKKQ